MGLANIYMPLFAWLILPLDINPYVPALDIHFSSWRLLILVLSLPSLFFGICLYILPESPKYLLAQGNEDDALKILRRVYAMNNNKQEAEYPVSKIILDEDGTDAKEKNGGIWRTIYVQTAPLFKPPYWLKTFMLCFLQFGLFFS